MAEDDFNAALAAQIKDRLRALGIPQVKVARRLDIDQSSVSRILSGDRKVSSFELTRLADLLEVSVTTLLGQEALPPQIYIDYSDRVMLVEENVTEALDEAAADAAMTGTGYIRLQRTPDGAILYSRLDPATVGAHD